MIAESENRIPSKTLLKIENCEKRCSDPAEFLQESERRYVEKFEKLSWLHACVYSFKEKREGLASVVAPKTWVRWSKTVLTRQS